MNRWINVVGNFETMREDYLKLRSVYSNILKNGHYVSLAMDSFINENDDLELRLDATFGDEDPGDMENFRCLCEEVSKITNERMRVKSGRSYPDPQN